MKLIIWAEQCFALLFSTYLTGSQSKFPLKDYLVKSKQISKEKKIVNHLKFSAIRLLKSNEAIQIKKYS